jgi:hypothetical protein
LINCKEAHIGQTPLGGAGFRPRPSQQRLGTLVDTTRDVSMFFMVLFAEPDVSPLLILRSLAADQLVEQRPGFDRAFYPLSKARAHIMDSYS